MYTAIEGIYENGQVILKEKPPITETSKVVIIFIEEKLKNPIPTRQAGSLSKLGALEGKTYAIPDDFNEPLDDLKEYME